MRSRAESHAPQSSPGKWVGPAKIAFDAEVVEVNDALTGTPKLANDDPYGAGWMVKVRPRTGPRPKRASFPAPRSRAPYEAKMTADNFAGCA